MNKKVLTGFFSSFSRNALLAVLVGVAGQAQAEPPYPNPYAQMQQPQMQMMQPFMQMAPQAYAMPMPQQIVPMVPMAPMPIAATGQTAMAVEPVIEGFADQVPLTIALQQVLPQGYTYALSPEVNPGTLVTWRGGRPWHVVLQDMLGASGLASNMNGNVVSIGGMGQQPSVVGAMPPQMQPMMQPQYPQVPLAPAPVEYQQPVPMQPMPQQMMQPPAEAYQPQPMPQMEPQPDQGQALMQPQPLQIENPAIFVPQVWEARPGQTLRQILQEWCGRVNTELNWSVDYDYPVMASVAMTGTFEEAVRTLLGGFTNARPTPQARLHYNPAAGQSILIVEVVGNHYGE